jgi:hypothetical protein
VRTFAITGSTGAAITAPPTVDVTVPVSRRVRSVAGVRVHFALHLDDTHHPSRIPPITRVEETVLDVVDLATTGDLEIIVRDGAELHLVGNPDVEPSAGWFRYYVEVDDVDAPPRRVVEARAGQRGTVVAATAGGPALGATRDVAHRPRRHGRPARHLPLTCPATSGVRGRLCRALPRLDAADRGELTTVCAK